MKKFMFCAVAGVLLLSGCAAEKTAVVDGGNVRVEGAGIEIDFPESWTVYTGDEMYSLIYERYSDSYSDVKSMKSALKTEGQEYILSHRAGNGAGSYGGFRREEAGRGGDGGGLRPFRA